MNLAVWLPSAGTPKGGRGDKRKRGELANPASDESFEPNRRNGGPAGPKSTPRNGRPPPTRPQTQPQSSHRPVTLRRRQHTTKADKGGSIRCLQGGSDIGDAAIVRSKQRSLAFARKTLRVVGCGSCTTTPPTRKTALTSVVGGGANKVGTELSLAASNPTPPPDLATGSSIPGCHRRPFLSSEQAEEAPRPSTPRQRARSPLHHTTVSSASPAGRRPAKPGTHHRGSSRAQDPRPAEPRSGPKGPHGRHHD